jgi:hypothetical protein
MPTLPFFLRRTSPADQIKTETGIKYRAGNLIFAEKAETPENNISQKKLFPNVEQKTLHRGMKNVPPRKRK